MIPPMIPIHHSDMKDICCIVPFLDIGMHALFIVPFILLSPLFLWLVCLYPVFQPLMLLVVTACKEAGEFGVRVYGFS